ncbi:MAG: SRPBCC family protein [Telmatospirillum sp.]|nr:SRPBCC family protein [Telmatospirillum sp.]
MAKVLAIRGWNAILNIHERRIPASLPDAGALLETLAGPSDRLWPHERWPAMILDRGLSVGSAGGHRAIRYRLAEHVPGRRIDFTFEAMPHLRLFRGHHRFEVIEDDDAVLLRHTIDVRTSPATWIHWKIFIEAIHDALIEDAFDKAERGLGVTGRPRSRWPLRVRLLRWWRALQAKRMPGSPR